MTDELIKRLRGDWFGYDVSLKAIDAMEEAADRIEALTADFALQVQRTDEQRAAYEQALMVMEADNARLLSERYAILADSMITSDQRAKYDALCARLLARKASEHEAVDAIRQLCRDNERLALRCYDARAALTGKDSE